MSKHIAGRLLNVNYASKDSQAKFSQTVLLSLMTKNSVKRNMTGWVNQSRSLSMSYQIGIISYSKV